MVRVVIEKVRILGIPGIKEECMVMLSPVQWSSSVQLLQLASYSLCLHGTYLNYMTDCHSVLCWSVVNL